MKTWFGKIISLALAVTMLFQLMPLSAIAAGAEQTDETVSVANYEEEYNANPTEASAGDRFGAEDVLFEDESLREENIKHFRMSDGSYIAVDYGHAVHYIDESGDYQEIDNRLVAPTVEDEQPELAAIEGLELEANENAVLIPEPTEFSAAQRGNKISVAAEAASDVALITIGSGDTEVKMSPYAAATVERMAMEELNPIDSAQKVIIEEQPEVIEPEVIEPEVIEPEVGEAEVVEPEAIEPEVIESEVIEPEVIESEVIEPEAVESEVTALPELSIIDALALVEDVAPLQMSAVAANVNNELSTAEEKTSLFDAIDPVKSRSAVIYEDIFPNVDLEYILIGNDVKENIIVKSKQESYVFPFLMELGGNMTMEAQEDGSVLILKNGAPVYSIAAPYMYDANGEASDLVSYEPIEVKPGVYLLVTEADADWINADGRAFPVTIDPSMNWYNQNSNMKVTYIESGSAGSDRQSSSVVYVGKNSGGNTYRTLFKLVNFPTLPDNSTVSSAYLQFTKSSYSNNGRASIILQAQPLQASSSYWSGSVNWTNCPALNTSLLDYTTVSNSTTTFGFDISREFVRWFTNGTCDNGLAIVAMEESAMTSSSCAYICMSKTSTSPTLIINYRNTVGIESYYTYQTQSIGRAGTGYVGDYSGNLTLVKPIVEHASTVMPVSVALVYNSATSAQNYQDFVYSYDYGYFGLGWKLSCMESVHSTDSGEKLVYIDGDGTNHYFTWSSAAGKYADEDGLGLYISANGSNYTMTDRYGGTKYFYNNMLYWVKDANGNQTTYDISSGKVAKITRTIAGGSTETIATFAYDSSSYLSSVTDSAGNVTRFTYAATTGGKNLTTVTHADGKTVSYGYYNGKLATATDNESAYQMSYTFGSNGRIVGIAEKANGQLGVKIYARGTVDGMQIYCYPGADRQVSATNYFNITNYGTTDKDNILTYLVFDYAGRTVNTYSTNYDGTVMYGADYAKYQSNSGTSLNNNRVLTASSVGVQPENYVKNSGFEGGTTAWSGGSVASAKTHTGGKSYALSAGATAQQTVGGLTAGKYYVVSAYVNTENASGTGTVSINDVQSINYKTDGWERIWITVQASSATMPIKIKATGFGNVYIDDVQVEQCITGTEGAPSNVNLMENGNMERADGWNYTTATVSYGTIDNRKVIKMTSGPSAVCNATQTININLPSSETYMFSGWAKADSGPINTADRFALKAIIKYDDNTTETFTETFCKDYGDWQYLSMPIVPSQRDKTVTVMTVYLNYNYNVNTAYFDNIALVREEAASYKYNDNGDLVSSASTDTDQQSYSYSGADLISQTTMGNGTYTYTYDSKHNVTSAKNDGVTMSMSYDGAGNTTSSVLTNATDSTKITSSATYTNNNNLLLKSTDSRGYSTEYTYTNAINKQLNIPSAVKDAKGITRYTSVNSQNGRTTQSYLTNKIYVDYGYTGGVLSTITRRGNLPGATGNNQTQTYTMAYNIFHQLTSVKVGTTTLATYTYASPDGLMTQMKYGNNHVVNYTYDALERPATVKYNDGTTFTYTYNGLGGLGKLHDSRGRDYVYNYDSLGRLISMREFNGSTIIQSMSSDYDSSNRVSTLSYKLDPDHTGGLETARTYGYTYNNADGTITKLTGPGGRLAYDYDNLNRLRYKNTYDAASGGNVVVGRQYSYLAGSGTNVSTNLVGSLTLKNGNSTYSTATYGYDELGNITSITATINGIAKNRGYSYDDQGQMLTETRGGVTYTYSYDTYGNIRTVKQGSSIVGTYTYGDGQWLDKLTAYNGATISYDGAGNPTNWPRISSLTWSNGKQLTGAKVGNKTLSFTYDVDGLRLTKYDGSDTHKYIWQGDRLVSESWGSNELEFFYDESGTPYAFDYNNTMYYYITNLQGDVIAITDSSGAIKASYEYDAWGKLVSDAPAANSIGAINPLRYRGYYFDTETGLYYLQSRYYDPEVCRFINADEFASTGQGFLGYNMFAYCNNSPLNSADPYGNLPCQNSVRMSNDGGGARSINGTPKPSMITYRIDKDKVGTYGYGFNLNAAFGFGVSGSVGITFDKQGNIGFIVTTAGGGGMASLGASGYHSKTTAPTIYQQKGWGLQTGGSFGEGIVVGAEYSMLPNIEENEMYHGVTGTVGFGLKPSYC